MSLLTFAGENPAHFGARNCAHCSSKPAQRAVDFGLNGPAAASEGTFYVTAKDSVVKYLSEPCIVIFAATWCGACANLVKHLSAGKLNFSGYDGRIVLVHNDHPENVASDAAQNGGIVQGVNKLSLEAFPTTAVFTRGEGGMVVDTFTGFGTADAWRKSLVAILPRQPPKMTPPAYDSLAACMEHIDTQPAIVVVGMGWCPYYKKNRNVALFLDGRPIKVFCLESDTPEDHIKTLRTKVIIRDINVLPVTIYIKGGVGRILQEGGEYSDEALRTMIAQYA